jgi:hypothetical protein
MSGAPQRPIAARLPAAIVSSLVLALGGWLELHPILRLCLFGLTLFTIARLFFTFDAFQPITFFIAAWAFVFAVHDSRFVTFDTSFDQLPSTTYLLACNAAVLLVCRLSQIPFRRVTVDPMSRKVLSENIYRDWRVYISVCAILGMVSSLCLTIEMLVLNSGQISDLASLRAIYQGKETSLYGQLAALLAPGALVAEAACVIFAVTAKPSEKLLWLTSAASLAASSLLSAGRMVILEVVLVAASSMLIRRYLFGVKRLTRRQKIVLLLLLSGSVSVMVYVGMSRNDGSMALDQFDLLLQLFGGRIDPLAQGLFDELPYFAKNTIIESISYCCAAIPYFSIEWNVVDLPRLYGLRQSPIIARRLKGVFPDIPTPVEMLEEHTLAIRSAGIFGNAWATWYAGFILDFGKIGAALLAMVYGASAWFAARRLFAHPSASNIMVNIGLSVVGAISPLFSAFLDTTMLVWFLIAAAIAVVARSTSSKGKEIENPLYR